MNYFKQIDTKVDKIFNEIPVTVENNPLTRLFMEKHKT
jgi:hypothetical protein